jgi:hypothetical protein
MGRLPWLFVLGIIAACGSFQGSDAAGDGGLEGSVDGGPGTVPVTTDVTVTVEWPAVLELDPYRDSHATKLAVVLSDATDPKVTRTQSLSPMAPGPYVFKSFASSGNVVATVQISGADDRLIGFGKRTADVHASPQVKVLARRRLLYFNSPDRDDGQLRAFDMANNGVPEGQLVEWPHTLPASLRNPSALRITEDGALVAQLGEQPMGTAMLSVVSTATHQATTIPLPHLSSQMIALDGHAMLAFPAAAAMTTVLTRVDLDTRIATDVASSSFKGGVLDVRDAAKSPDGRTGAIVGSYGDSSGNNSRELLATVDLRTATLSELPLSPVPTGLGGVRFSPDGKSLLLSIYRDGPTGQIISVDLTSHVATSLVTAAPNKSQLTSLILGPSGQFAFSSAATLSLKGSNCCDGLHVFDLRPMTHAEIFTAAQTPGGPAFDVSSAVVLPYAPYTVIGGQSDGGNNVNVTDFVDLSTPSSAAPPKIQIQMAADIGSVDSLLTPFGTQL